MIFTIENEFISVSVKKAGAELNSFKSKETGTEYLWQGNPDIWYGQSPVLFPIVGTLLNNAYLSEGKEYTLYRHGIARKRDFKLKEQGNDYLVLVQRYDDETLKSYPFEYELLIEFRLEGKTLKVTHRVKTLGNKTMYFSIGAHPGFNCKVGDIIEFEKPETLSTERIDKENLIIPEKFPLIENSREIEITKEIFEPDALILSDMKSEKLRIKGENEIEFTFGKCPFLGIWAKPGAPYVCLEPWYGVNDGREVKNDISEKRGIQKLGKGGEFSFSWTAEIK